MNEQSAQFLFMLAAAVGLSAVPYARRPLQWIETFFHEFSHGLATLLTFGYVRRLKIQFNGGGWCEVAGGFRFLVLNAGYMGAVLWGALIYVAGTRLGEGQVINVFIAILAMLFIVTILWVRSLSTLIIMGFMASIFSLPLIYPTMQGLDIILQFIGMYVMLNAVKAPLHLIDGKHEGDGAALADMTKILPEGVWIIAWFAFALIVLYQLWLMVSI